MKSTEKETAHMHSQQQLDSTLFDNQLCQGIPVSVLMK